MSLKHPLNTLAIPNSQEELYTIGYDIIGPEMERLLNKSWDFNLKGKGQLANSYNEAANVYSYLFTLALFAHNYLERLELLDSLCDKGDVAEKFCFECLEEKLPCRGTQFRTNYLGAWNKLQIAFKLVPVEGCPDCDEGVGGMIIEGGSCNGFIIK